MIELEFDEEPKNTTEKYNEAIKKLGKVGLTAEQLSKNILNHKINETININFRM